jgi:acyl dehydratase
MASLVRLALARKPGIGPDETVPRLERSSSLHPLRGLKAYASVCGLPNPPAGTPVPLLWPAVLAAPLHLELFADPLFPLKAMGMVHVRNAVTWTRPVICLDQMVDMTAYVEGHRPHHRGVEIDLITELHDSESVFWREVKTILCPGVPTAERPPKQEPSRFHADRSTIWSLRGDLGRRYARVAGDRNPIHQYAWAAKLFGFKRHLIHGMWSLARGVGEMDSEIAAAGSLEMAFVRPIYLPSRVLFESGVEGERLRFAVRNLNNGKVFLEGAVRSPDA